MKVKLLTVFLILVVASPLNATVESWMSLHASPTTAKALTTMDNPRSAPAHEVQAVSHHAGHGNHGLDNTSAQDQGDIECDDHCLNCISHCYSAAIFALSGESPLIPAVISLDITGESRSRKYLLFRPPKSAPGISGWFAVA